MKKDVTEEEAKKSGKYWQLLVFKCEADWAYGMMQRQIISQGGVQQ